MVAVRCDVTYARMDIGHVGAEIFELFERGKRRNGGLEKTIRWGDSYLEFSNAEKLGAAEQDFLLALVALAGPLENGVELKWQSNDNTTKQIRESLQATGIATRKNNVMIETTFYQLEKLVGRKNPGKKKSRTQEMIKRLAKTSVFVGNENEEASSNLLSYYLNKQTGKIQVALNWRISEVVLGYQTQFASISISERSRLESDHAKLLHCWLHSVINPGQTKPFKWETLARHLWVPSENLSTQRVHRSRVKKAVTEIGRTGWKVVGKGNTVYITRPKLSQ